jgi:hypothetical protein
VASHPRPPRGPLFTSPPHPAGLVIEVHLGFRVARLGTDHGAGGSLQRRVLVTAERQPRIAITPAGGSTRIARLNRHRTSRRSGPQQPVPALSRLFLLGQVGGQPDDRGQATTSHNASAASSERGTHRRCRLEHKRPMFHCRYRELPAHFGYIAHGRPGRPAARFSRVPAARQPLFLTSGNARRPRT